MNKSLEEQIEKDRSLRTEIWGTLVFNRWGEGDSKKEQVVKTEKGGCCNRNNQKSRFPGIKVEKYFKEEKIKHECE